jgi:WD40 repeat protein
MASPGPVVGLDFSKDGKTLVVSSEEDRTLRLWDVATTKERAVCRGHSWNVRCVAVSPDGRLAASVDRGGTVILWDVSSGAQRGHVAGDERTNSDIVELRGRVAGDRKNSLAFTPDGSKLLVGNGDGTVKVWDVASLQSRYLAEPPPSGSGTPRP